jgi:hypothetical protein
VQTKHFWRHLLSDIVLKADQMRIAPRRSAAYSSALAKLVTNPEELHEAIQAIHAGGTAT